MEYGPLAGKAGHVEPDLGGGARGLSPVLNRESLCWAGAAIPKMPTPAAPAGYFCRETSFASSSGSVGSTVNPSGKGGRAGSPIATSTAGCW